MTEWALPAPRLVELPRRRAGDRGPARPPSGSSRSSAPAGSGGTSRRSTPRATRCTRGCSASRTAWPTPRPTAEADPDYLDVARAGALSRPVQLPLLARRLRRPLSAPPPQRDLPPPDRRAQRARRRRGADRPPRRARGRPTSTSTPARKSGSRTTGWSRFVRPATGGHIYELDVRAGADQRPGHARPPPRGLSRSDRRGGAAAGPGLPRPGERPEPGRSSSRKGSTGCSSTTGTRARRSSITSTRST